MTLSLHPVDLGDLPEFVQYSAVDHLIPIEAHTLKSHWKTRYQFVERRAMGIGGLSINIKQCDEWLDARGKALLSMQLLKEKIRRNPGWVPAGERIEALAGAHDGILNELADLVAQKLSKNFTAKVGGAG